MQPVSVPHPGRTVTFVSRCAEVVDPTDIRAVIDDVTDAAGRFAEAQRALTELLDAVDRSRYWEFSGARSVEDWLEHQTGLDRREVRHMTRRSRLLAALPRVAKLAAAGTVPIRVIDALARIVGDLSTLTAADDDALVDLLDPDRPLAVLLDRVADWAADRDDACDDEEQRYRDREVVISRDLFGDVRLGAYLPGDDGERVVAALHASTPPPDPDAADERRSLATRRADALVDLCVGDTIARPATTIVRGAGRRDHQSRAVSTEATERLSCDAHVLDGGRRRRTFSAAQRRALAARYRRCLHPLCDVPFHLTELHHVHHWEDGGPTDLANAVPVCRYHHHWLHERRWRLTGDHVRGWTLHPPPDTDAPDPPLRC